MRSSLRALVARCTVAEPSQQGQLGLVRLLSTSTGTQLSAGAAGQEDGCPSLGQLAGSGIGVSPSPHSPAVATTSAAFSPGPWWLRSGTPHAHGAPRSQPYPTSPTCAWVGVGSHARHYAKPAAAAAPGAAGAGATPTKRFRTSQSKIYSCRNDRLRHTHEQIWPTLQLTDLEAAAFRANSRAFLVELGRPLSLRAKYRLGLQAEVLHDQQQQQHGGAGGGVQDGGAVVGGAGAGVKVPYGQARSLLQEPNLHLDALGENPRYLRLRRLRSSFATKLQNLRKLRLLLGFQRRKTVQSMYHHALVSRGSHRMWKLVSAMEANMAMFVTRMGLSEDITGSVKAVRHDKLYLNGRAPAMPYKGYLVPGDVVSPSAGSAAFFRKRITRSLGPDILAHAAADFLSPGQVGGEEAEEGGEGERGAGGGGSGGRRRLVDYNQQ